MNILEKGNLKFMTYDEVPLNTLMYYNSDWVEFKGKYFLFIEKREDTFDVVLINTDKNLFKIELNKNSYLFKDIGLLYIDLIPTEVSQKVKQKIIQIIFTYKD